MILRFGFVALVALLGLPNDTAVSAFSTTTTSLTRNGKGHLESLAFVTAQQPRHDRAKLATLPFVGASTKSPLTKLDMGKMEEFLTGRDDKQRKADNDSYLAELQKRVDRINGLEAEIEELGDDELMVKTEEFKERLKKGEDINGPLLEETFAVVREAAW